MKIKLFLIFFILVLTYSCKKDEDENFDNNSSSILVGDRSLMNTTTYDTLIVVDIFMKSFEIDVDNDQIKDFRFESFNLSGTALGVTPQYGVSVDCLQSSAGILCYSETDTLFSNLIKDTVQYNSKIDIYLRHEESCSRINTNDTIKKIWDQNKVIIRKTGQKISKSERFAFDSITITRTSFWTVPQAFYFNQDTTIYQQYIYLDQCNTVQNDVTLFFGIKIGDKLGWIKLMIMDDYKLFLMESALQK